MEYIVYINYATSEEIWYKIPNSTTFNSNLGNAVCQDVVNIIQQSYWDRYQQTAETKGSWQDQELSRLDTYKCNPESTDSLKAIPGPHEFKRICDTINSVAPNMVYNPRMSFQAIRQYTDQRTMHALHCSSQKRKKRRGRTSAGTQRKAKRNVPVPGKQIEEMSPPLSIKSDMVLNPHVGRSNGDLSADRIEVLPHVNDGDTSQDPLQTDSSKDFLDTQGCMQETREENQHIHCSSPVMSVTESGYVTESESETLTSPSSCEPANMCPLDAQQIHDVPDPVSHDTSDKMCSIVVESQPTLSSVFEGKKDLYKSDSEDRVKSMKALYDLRAEFTLWCVRQDYRCCMAEIRTSCRNQRSKEVDDCLVDSEWVCKIQADKQPDLAIVHDLHPILLNKLAGIY